MDTADFRQGVRDVLPLLLGVIPFGLVAGIAAVDAGLGVVGAAGMSLVVFAGASQLAALDLLGNDAPVLVVVVTAAVINLRMLMYSASIAPYFRKLSASSRAVLAYLLTDQAYALSIAAYRDDRPVDRTAYYLGVGVTLWAVWQVTTVAGVVLGTGVPDAWGLDFAVPLVFLALLVPAMEDRASTAAAVVGGGVAVAGAGLPLNIGLPAGATVGVLAGLAVETLAAGDTAPTEGDTADTEGDDGD
jgi:4-azaleucine resistance transporter AzlC